MTVGAERSIQSSARPRRVVAALFVVAVFAWGLAFYGLGFYLNELPARGGWSTAVLSLMTFGFYAVSTVLGLAVGLALQRTDARSVFTIGAVALGTATIAMGAATSTWSLVGAYLLLAVGWACLNMNPISSTVLAWYGERSSAPLTVALTGASAGGIVVIPVLVWLKSVVGFGTALAIVGAVEIVVVGGLAVFVVRSPDRDPDRERGGGGIAWDLFRHRPFWLLTGGLGLAIAAQVGFLVHQLSLLTATMDDAAAAIVVAATTTSALVGRLFFIAAARRADPAPVGFAFLALQVLALLGLNLREPSTAILAAVSIVFGLGVGVLITLPPLLTRSMLAGHAFDAAFPLVNALYAVGVAIGAPLLTALHLLTGSYPRAAVALAGIDLLALALLGSARSRSRGSAG